MLWFWLSNNWFLVVLTLLCACVLIFCAKVIKANDVEKVCGSPIDEAAFGILTILFGAGTITLFVAMMFSLHQTSESYGKTYTMVVNIHYPSNHVVRKTFVSENEAFTINYGSRSTIISGADGTYLRVNAPIEIVSNTYKQNGK